MIPTLSHAGTIVRARIGSAARLLSLYLFISLLSTPLRGIDRDRRIDELYHTSWTLKDGAPSEIFAIAQTIDGYLWLGTTTGLVRFDGIHFENYESPFGQAFPAKNASSLLAIPDGGLWIGFSSGEVSLLKNGRITSYSQKDGLPPSTVRSLARDRQGRIWAASVTGLSLFDGSLWRRVGADWNFSGGATAALVDRAGTIWIGTPDRVVFVPEGAGKFQTAAAGLKTATHYSRYVTSLAEASDGTVWMSALAGPVQPVRPQSTGNRYPEIQSGSLKSFFDDQGSLWVATLGNGLRRAPNPDRFGSRKAAELNGLTEVYGRADGLTSDYIESIFQDSEGDIWVGTSAGLDRFRQSAATPVSLPSIPYKALAPGERGTVWVASGYVLRLLQGRRLLDKRPEEFAQIQPGAKCIYRDAKGTLWIATHDSLLEMTGRHLSQFAYPNGTKSDNDGKGAAVTMTEAHPAGMWVSILGDEVYRFAGGKWTSLGALGGPRGVAGSAFTDPNGPAWFGFLDQTVVRIDDGGVRVFDAQDGVQVGKVRCIQGHDGKVWIGGDSGVAWFDGSRFLRLIPSGGALRDVFGILETDEGLWLSEHTGIIYVSHSELLAFEKDPKHQVSFRIFGFLDGLAAPLQRSTAGPALVQSSDGLLWFATTQGLVFVDPRRIPKNTVPPPVSITSVVANSKSYIPTSGLALPARVRNLQIDYAGLSLAIPERVKYRYMLEGYETDWQEAGARGQAFYTNPGPGSYTFRVMAANPDGLWNESGATIGFSIAPAFYETFWFRLLCALAAGGIVWILYLLRLSMVTAQLQARLGERLLERERIARDLHDTLLQSFQGLMLHLEVVNELLPHGKAKAELTKSLGHADRAIAEGRSAVYDLRSSARDTNDLPESIKAVGDELSAEGTATFRLVVEGPPREVHTMIRDELYRITREALRNAFRHAHARHIETEITYGERTFRLRIRDDGEGIPPELLAEGRPGHYGMPGMRERARQIGGKFDIWSGAGTGTEIDLSVAGSIAYCTSTGRSLFRLFRKKAG
jgi:signal transduction histidine kinase/ligand-binding sensor domain-containing protein